LEFPDLVRVSAHPDLVRLARHCAAMAGERNMPQRRSLDPQEVVWLLGRIFLLDVLEGGADYRYRLFGSAMAMVYGEDLTGRRLSELGRDGFESAMRADYDAVVATRAPLFRRGDLLWPGKEYVGVERLLVPLSDDDRTVSMILGAACYGHTGHPPVELRSKGRPRFVPTDPRRT
jgi:hypothetical protein